MTDVASPSLIQPPKKISPQKKAFAFERACGITPAEACRRVGGKVENGLATKWENDKAVQQQVAYFRSLGNDEEMLAAKRARIEERLALAAFGNIFDFAEMVDHQFFVHVDDGTEEGASEKRIVKTPIIDWDKVAASPYGAIIAGFKFDKDSGHLVDFERDSALQAIAQLRDMHGFKAPAKIEATGAGGGAMKFEDVTPADRVRALAVLMSKVKAETQPA